MSIQSIVLIHLPMVSLFSCGKAGSEGFLKQRIPAVSLVGQNVVDSRNIPPGVSKPGGNLAVGQIICDCLFSFPSEKSCENFLNNERLFWMGTKYAVFQGVAKRRTAP